MLGIRSSPRLAGTSKSTATPSTPTKKKVSRLSLSKLSVSPSSIVLSAREVLCKYFFRSTQCRIVGRVEEKYALAQFLQSPTESLLFIGGNPGTGKTALVTEFLNQEFDAGWSYVNVIDDPHLRSITPCKVLVLDEVDTINDSYARSKQLIEEGVASKVIGIANTVDLMLCNSAAKSMIFPPYAVQDIIAIINDRIRQAEAEALQSFKIDPMVIELVARKSAGLGDLRRSLDLFREVVQNVSFVDCSIILTDALKVISECSAPTATALLDKLSLHQKILLAALLSNNTPSKNLTLESLYEGYRRICKQSRIAEAIARGDFFDLVSGLEAEGIVQIKKKRISQVPDWTHLILLAQESSRETFTRELGKVPLLCDYL